VLDSRAAGAKAQDFIGFIGTKVMPCYESIYEMGSNYSRGPPIAPPQAGAKHLLIYLQ